MGFEYAPLYIKIREDIKSKIHSGHYKPKEKCMSEREIKEHYGVSDTTAKKAIYELVHEGFLYREHGRGTFVAEFSEKPDKKNVLILIPDIRTYMYPPIVRGIEDVLHRNNYSPIIYSFDSNPEKEKKYFQKLLDDDIAGMIITPGTFPFKFLDVLEKAKDKGFVIVNRRIESLYGDSVLSDDFPGAYNAVKYLIELGHKRIALLALPQAHSASAEARTEGYRKALEDFGIKYDKRLCIEIKDIEHELTTYAAVNKIIASKIPFDAIFAQSDLMAVWAHKALAKANLRVPEDISLIGYSDSDIAQTYSPALTTVRQPFYEMGSKAGELLMEQLQNGKKKLKELVLLPTELIVRESTSPKKIENFNQG
jgi:GntR family transcriptional regulator, arabinose operon transcriptional repressor